MTSNVFVYDSNDLDNANVLGTASNVNDTSKFEVTLNEPLIDGDTVYVQARNNKDVDRKSSFYPLTFIEPFDYDIAWTVISTGERVYKKLGVSVLTRSAIDANTDDAMSDEDYQSIVKDRKDLILRGGFTATSGNYIFKHWLGLSEGSFSIRTDNAFSPVPPTFRDMSVKSLNLSNVKSSGGNFGATIISGDLKAKNTELNSGDFDHASCNSMTFNSCKLGSSATVGCTTKNDIIIKDSTITGVALNGGTVNNLTVDTCKMLGEVSGNILAVSVNDTLTLKNLDLTEIDNTAVVVDSNIEHLVILDMPKLTKSFVSVSYVGTLQLGRGAPVIALSKDKDITLG